MKKIIGPAVLLLLLAGAAAAQEKLDEAAAKQLKAQADEMSRAFIAGDNDRMVDFLHPKLIQMAGSRAKLVEFLDGSTRDLKQKGFEALSYVVSEPLRVLKVGPRTYALVTTKLRVKTPAGVYVHESYTVALTDDGGANWKFVAASNNTPEELAFILPDIKGKLEIPKRKPIELEPLPAPAPTSSPAPTPTPTPAP